MKPTSFPALLRGLTAGLLMLPLITCGAAQPPTSSPPQRAPLKKIRLPRQPLLAAYVLSRFSNDELVQLERIAPVDVAILDRPGLARRYRLDALRELARLHKRDELSELLDAVRRADARDNGGAVLGDLAPLLVEQSAAALNSHRAALEQLASTARRPAARQVAYAALVRADGSFDSAWRLAQTSTAGAADVLDSAALVPDAKLRGSLYPRAVSLLQPSARAEARRAAVAALAHLPGHESDAFAQLACCVRDNVERDTAIRGLESIPRDRWSREAASPLADNLTAEVSALPLSARNEPAARDALALASDLLSLLPSDHARKLRGVLSGLSVQVVPINTVREQMLFDRKLIVVTAGRPVQIIFHNADTMPHNLVIAAPGSLAELGAAAEVFGLKPEARTRNFVPPSDKVLQSIRMMNEGESAALTFVAPRTPGSYPIVCTYPGHWRRMYGVLLVVENSAAYLAANPRLPTAESLLGLPEFVQDYTIDDLVGELDELRSGRSFERGRATFTTASCIGCHRMRGVGGNVGPELTAVSRKYKPREVLREVVEPSAVIDDKYAALEILRTDGRSVRGTILAQNPRQITLLPLGPPSSGRCEPIVVMRDEIEENGIHRSKISPMPKGLLNTMDKEQILDLLAYVLAGGDQNNPAFHKR